MPFSIIRNDITKLSCDAIVNAANPRLLEGGGVCGAIFEAAGKEALSKACEKIGFCDIGQAVITKGYGLNARYIIHTVGPVYGKDPKAEEEQLYCCYKNSLMLALRKRLSSIAFPVISSGIYRYPKAEAISVATRAIKDFLEENEMQVYLVVYDKDTFSISEKMFAAVESYIDDRMVKPQNIRRRSEEVFPCAASVFITDGVCERNAVREEAFDANEIREAREFYAKSAPLQKSVASKPRLLSELVDRKVETFSEMLLRLIDEKGMTDVEVYKRANIDRKLFSKIRKKDYTPKKTTVIALAISLRLNMDEARDLLCRAGFAFSECSKFDIIIEYFIENRNYDIFQINETLFAFDEQLLGA